MFIDHNNSSRNGWQYQYVTVAVHLAAFSDREKEREKDVVKSSRPEQQSSYCFSQLVFRTSHHSPILQLQSQNIPYIDSNPDYKCWITARESPTRIKFLDKTVTNIEVCQCQLHQNMHDTELCQWQWIMPVTVNYVSNS